MLLSHLEVDGLRNLKQNRLELPEGLTVIVGQNGQGKTSLLEAIYLLGTGRSFRSRRLDELVTWKGGPGYTKGRIVRPIGETRLAVELSTGSRRLLVSGGERELEDYLGRLDVVDLTGERMHVLRGAPDERRRFLDRGIVGLRSGYLHDLGAYRRVLAHRNALLRRGGSAAELDVWSDRLVSAAVMLHLERRGYADRLGRCLIETGAALLPAGRELSLRYRPSPGADKDLDRDRLLGVFKHQLTECRGRDLELGYTTRGPHRDEIEITLDGVDLRKFGSAGQVRAAMIALKLSKLSLLHEERGESPLFLMDDFDTDLDEVRASALADFLRQGGFQALVATSKQTLVGRIGVINAKLVMDDGVARAG